MRSFTRYTIAPASDFNDAINLFIDLGFYIEDDLADHPELTYQKMLRNSEEVRVFCNLPIDRSFIEVFDGEGSASMNAYLQDFYDKKNGLSLLRVDEALRLSENHNEIYDIFYAVFSSGSRYDEKVAKVIETLAGDKDNEVRFYLCASLAYLVGWDDFRNKMLIALYNDPDQGVRDMAHKIVQFGVNG